MTIHPPKVTGLSPKEGPPGTRIIIRGENLGKSQNDVIGLTICGLDCLTYVEWQSASKIIARIGATPVPLRGDVVVTTHSGGEGSCTVQFRCYIEPIGPLKESAVWVDESHLMTVGGRNRPTSPSQINPEDPLGFNTTVGGTIKPFSEDELQELFPEGSGNLLSENFSPVWYLLENHQPTRFEDLKVGLATLTRKVHQHKEGPLAFLKSNISSIMECLDVLSSLQQAMQTDVKAAGTELTEKLEVVLQKTKVEAENIFQTVLERKDKAEMSRNALAVLQRYRFLFNLPANIEKSIQKGDVVINDYARAKSLFHDTQVSIFKKLYQEVELAIEKFRHRLMEQLMKLPATLEDQKKLIKYLASLECPGDPAWDCICNMNSWIIGLLNQCRDKHQALASSESANSEMPQVVIFVEDIMAIFSEQFPSLWKLGQAYIGGHLYMKDVSKPEEKKLPRETALKVMVQDCVGQLCRVVRAALLPHTLPTLSLPQLQALGSWPKSSLESWLPHLLRTVRSCYGVLLRLELPEEAVHEFQTLVLDLRVFTMSSLFIQAADEVRVIYEKETWSIEMDDYNGGITQLPLMFENIVTETLQVVRETAILSGPRESDVFSQLNVQATVKQHIQSLFLAFVSALQEMPYVPAAASTTRSQSEMCDATCFLTESQRLLVVLSNTAFTSSIILPRIQENFGKHGFPDITLVIKFSQSKFSDLGLKLFDKYLENKCGPVVGAIETSMYIGEFDWRACPAPTGVSNYIKELVINMVKVNAEVFSISPPYLTRVMRKLMEAVCEELGRLYDCAGTPTLEANCQIALDIRALDEILTDYKHMSDKISKFYPDCTKNLKPISSKENMMMEELFSQFKSSMKLQLMCFSVKQQKPAATNLVTV